MGVTGLWQLLEPVGRRVNIETLTNKRLAIDASIWLVQFIKAMRDERGEVLRNAHLLGFFRRICKLLFHRVRPVFVFDGATPALKRRTTAARRRLRDQQQAKVRKAAEKLLLNRLKHSALSTAAATVGSAGLASTSATPQAVPVLPGPPGGGDGGAGMSAGGSSSGAAPFTAAADELLAEQLQVEEAEQGANGEGDGTVSRRGAESVAVQEAVRASLRPSEMPGPSHLASGPAGTNQPSAAAKGKAIIDLTGNSMPPPKEGYQAEVVAIDDDDDEDEDDDDDDDIINQLALPEDVTELDASVLSTLPPSIQFDIMTKLREEQFNQNRVKFQAVASDAAAFSQTQLASYLKASAFRRKLNSIRDNRGTEARKVANDSGREFIYQVDPEVAGDDQPGPSGTAPEPEAAATEDEPEKGPADGGVFEISMDVPLSMDREAFWRLGEEQEAGDGSASDGHEDDGMEWEDVQPSGLSAAVPTKRPEHWRERAQQRQRFWSRTHGFQLGRKLGDWSKSEAETSEPPEPEQTAAGDDTITGRGEAWASPALPSPAGGAVDLTGASDGEEEQDASGGSDFEWEDAEPVAVAAATEDRATAAAQPAVEAGPVADEDQVVKVEKPASTKGLADIPRSPAKLFEKEELMMNATADFPAVGVATDLPKAEVNEGHRPVGSRAAQAEGSPDEIDLSASIPRGAHEGAMPAANAEAKEAIDCEPHAVASGSILTAGLDNGSSAPVVAEHGARGVPSVVGPPPGHMEVGSPRQDQGAWSLRQEAEALPVAGVESPQKPKESSGQPLPGQGPSQPQTGSRGHRSRSEAAGHGSGGDDKAGGSAASVRPATGPAGVEPPAPAGMEDSTYHLPGVDRPGDVQPPASPLQDASPRQQQQQQGLSTQDYEAMMGELDSEEAEIREQQRRFARNADTPTPEMYAECQELLQMFGLPYIIAPMEAEAQCSWLNAAGLVDGVVTDDNDAFLFGAKQVFRNIFESNKYVEHYQASDIESELGLSQDKLVALSLLLGSDYTEGVPGIGIVNAAETVLAFLPQEGMPQARGQGWEAFKEWVKSPDVELFASATARKSRGKGRGKVASAGDGTDAQEDNDNGSDAEMEQTPTEGKGLQPGVEEEPANLREFKQKHRRVSKNWELPQSFPNGEVIKAYKEPHVDRSKDRFTFGRPDVAMLQTFCSNKFGWLPAKSDELLNPIVKVFDERESQTRMEQFFNFSQRFAKIRSQRLQKAVQGISRAPNPEMNLQDDEVATAASPPSSSRPRKRKGDADTSAVAAPQPKRTRGKGMTADPAPEAPPGSQARAPGRGRGRGRSGGGRRGHAQQRPLPASDKPQTAATGDEAAGAGPSKAPAAEVGNRPADGCATPRGASVSAQLPPLESPVTAPDGQQAVGPGPAVNDSGSAVSPAPLAPTPAAAGTGPEPRPAVKPGLALPPAPARRRRR